MNTEKRAVVLVGHGGLPSDCPDDLVARLKRLENQRRKQNLPPTEEELEIDHKIRQWPRTPESDPYKNGLEAIALQLSARLGPVKLVTAYNEFCAPTLEEAVDGLVQAGKDHISLVSTMFTPGGSHSEIEIPEEVRDLQLKYPEVEIVYAWPFDLRKVAEMLFQHIESFQSSTQKQEV
ncbi:MAG: hypothetical protein NPINA01_08610 [Nitrospinaceae bacterium]|nr:MAG: hypothetical protein NPINA01_08610 [Nitrospinaceae bacterium]